MNVNPRLSTTDTLKPCLRPHHLQILFTLRSQTCPTTRLLLKQLALMFVHSTGRLSRSNSLMLNLVVHLAQWHIRDRTCGLLLQWGPATYAQVCTVHPLTVRCFNVDTTWPVPARISISPSVFSVFGLKRRRTHIPPFQAKPHLSHKRAACISW